MTSYKQRDARAQETPQAKRERLADPALADSVEEQRSIQESNPTLQQNKRQAAADISDNLRRALEGAIAAVKVATPGRDIDTNGRFRYDRNYQRMREAARQVVLQSGKPVSVPAYLPAPAQTELTAELGPEDFRASSAYRETLGMGPSGRGGPLPGYPGSDQDNAWLAVQGEVPKK